MPYRHRNYTVSAAEQRAFGSIGNGVRRATRAAQPKPESFSIEEYRTLSASEKFDLAIRREMKSLTYEAEASNENEAQAA
jgi:hypothetical protein